MPAPEGTISEEAAIEAGKAKLREYITTVKGPYRFSIDKNGSVSASRYFGPKDGEVWGGLVGNEVTEIVPAGTTREETLRMLKDKIGLEKGDAEKFLTDLEKARAKELEVLKTRETERRQMPSPSLKDLLTNVPNNPDKHFHVHRDLEPDLRIHPKPTEQPKTADAPKANPHVVLKSGDTVGGLYNSIPKDQRPPFEDFKKEFMIANPSVTDHNKVFAGKDYALPSKYNYDGLKQAHRLIEPNIAELARQVASAVVSSSLMSFGDPAHGVTTGKSSGTQAR